ncbi:MAG: CehA/McbA family metallohydrolase [Kofleriaceae bacterium]
MTGIRRTCACLALMIAACGGDDGGGGGLADYFPPLPPTGGAQAVWAGAITPANPGELLTGPAAQGQVGDFFLRNDRARFIVGAATRVLGVVPQGGNVIDAALVVDGQPLPDHFGELSMVYKAGRTCEPTRVEVVADGSAGGAAVLRSIGKTGNNDFINMRGIGLLPIPDEINPDIDDELECATTYILRPDATELEVYWSVWNGTTRKVAAPLGALNDTGGETEAWSNGRGFERAGIGALSSLSTPAPIDYVVYQGPGPAYGIVPRFDDATRSAGFIIAGVSIVLFGGENLLDIFDASTFHLQLPPQTGVMQRVDLVLGQDAEDVDVAWRSARAEALVDLTGTVVMSDGGSPAGARVGVYLDVDGDGAIGPDDTITSYLDAAADGTFAGKIPATGTFLVRAERKDVGRSPAVAAGPGVALTIPAPVRLDYQILDAATGDTMPGRLLVLGVHPAYPDQRVFETYDRLAGVVRSIHAVAGTSTGTLADPALYLPAGGTYRVYASRGTEWSTASARFDATAPGEVTLPLHHVIDTAGYLAAEFHVHQIGSPDSPVGSMERVRSALSAGVELFAVTDHDVVSDLQPLVEDLAAEDLLRVVPGIEITPFAYGHFNAYPMQPQATPNGGAVDWGRGSTLGKAMTPGEIFAGARARGARVVEVNHPRGSSALSRFQAYFDRANLTYDYAQRTIDGDFAGADIPNDWLRLPDESLWNDGWNALEIWNGFAVGDTDGDGRRELTSLDRVLRDWFNMLNLGYYVAPVGNSDTHTSVSDPLGMPRNMVRVADDSEAALADGSATGEVMQTLEGSAVARDIVVTNGPMLAVTAAGQPAIGRQVPAASGTVTLQVTVTAPAWADVDTLEVFANATPVSPVPDQITSALHPLACWTSRPLPSVVAPDPCAGGDLPVQAMTVQTVSVPGPGNVGFLRATVTVTIDRADIPSAPGAVGADAWLVFRARGAKAVFPLLQGDLVDDTTLPILVSGTPAEVDALLRSGIGVPATAFTAPVFIDFDGGGYRAPFAP